jgi:hypothetical protein
MKSTIDRDQKYEDNNWDKEYKDLDKMKDNYQEV